MKVRTGLVAPTRTGEKLAPRVERHDDGEPPWARPLLILACVGVLVAIAIAWPQ